MPDSNIQIKLDRCQTVEGLEFQLLEIELTASDRIVEPQDLVGLELPAGIDYQIGVVLSGRAPIWLYAYLVHQLHPTKWIACFDPRLGGGIVVTTHSKEVKIGQIVAVKA